MTATLTKSDITLAVVWAKASKIIFINEYFHPVNKWTNILPDGSDVSSTNQYYETVPGAKSALEIKPDIREDLVAQCLNAGAEAVSFMVVATSGERRTIDFDRIDLIRNS